MHDLDLVAWPGPQVTLQEDHILQEDQPPFTIDKKYFSIFKKHMHIPIECCVLKVHSDHAPFTDKKNLSSRNLDLAKHLG